jgi:hypothetical protein
MDFRILNRFSVILTQKTKWKKGEQYWVAFRPKASVARPGPTIEMPHDVAAARRVEHGQRACPGRCGDTIAAGVVSGR